MNIRTERGGKRAYLPLLLEADPCEAMIDRYLDTGTLYVMTDAGVTVCTAVVTETPEHECELKNIAVAERFRKRGFASRMLEHLFQTYEKRYRFMYVGTSETAVPFYEKNGFEYSHTVRNFFTENYPGPVLDGGKLCTDMIYLKRKLN